MGSVVWFIVALLFFVLLIVVLWFRKKERFGPAPDRNVYVRSVPDVFWAHGGGEFGGREGEKVSLILKGFICYQGELEGKNVDVYWTDAWTSLYHFVREEQEKKDVLWGDNNLGNCFADPQEPGKNIIISKNVPIEYLVSVDKDWKMN